MNIYYKNTGEIYAITTGGSFISGEEFIECDDKYIRHNSHYVDISNMVIAMRPSFTSVFDKTSIQADGVSAATITGLPVGTTVSWDGNAHVINDGTLEFSADHPGEYRLTFSLFPYIEKTVTITAKAPI